MHTRSIDDLGPTGGFPKQRISRDGEQLVAPPNYKNMYSELSKLPADEKNFEYQNFQPRQYLSGVGAPRRRGVYFPVGSMTRHGQSGIDPDLKRALRHEREVEKRMREDDIRRQRGVKAFIRGYRR